MVDYRGLSQRPDHLARQHHLQRVPLGKQVSPVAARALHQSGLYFEYENINQADKSLLEVVGHQNVADLRVPNALLRQETERSLEMKLILSSNVKGWNFPRISSPRRSLNESEGWEFGYALRRGPAPSVSSKQACMHLLPREFLRRAELYGGLGTTDGFGWKATSQYLGRPSALIFPRADDYLFSASA